MIATYSPKITKQKEAAARCGLRIKYEGTYRNTAHLIDDATGVEVWAGFYADAWQFMRNSRGLREGAH